MNIIVKNLCVSLGPCIEGQFTCSDGTCVNGTTVCEGTCADGSMPPYCLETTTLCKFISL